jgi:RNA polymerase sigma-70 factor (ECF subfamily)
MTAKIILFKRNQEESDEDLLLAVTRGNVDALEVLFERYHDTIYNYLSRFSWDERDIEDMTQSTFLEVQKSSKSFRGRSQVRTWLFGLASNIARNMARGEARRRSFLTKLAILPETSPTRPDEITEHRQALTRAREALDAMPHHLREVFVLCDLEDLSGEEAADALGLNESTLWRRLREARKALRAALGNES